MRLATHVAGTGDATIMLLHGWSYHSAIWGREVLALGEHWRIVLPDLPGHGRTPLCAKEGLIREVAVAGIADAWQRHNLSGSPVIAWALGAQLVVDAMARDLIDPSRVLLIGMPTPSGVVPDPRHGPLWRDWPRYSSTITRMMFASPPSPEMERWLGRMASQTNLAAAAGFLKEGWAPPAPSEGFRLPPGSAIVHGTLDAIAPFSAAAELATSWSARVHELTGLAHCPFLEEWELYAELRNQWLEAA